MFTRLITWADQRSVTKICQWKKHAAPSSSLSECTKMPNNGTKTLAGDGSAIALDEKALDKKGWTAWTRMCRKTEEESAWSPVLQDAVTEVPLVRKSPVQ
jgi:hypothetical protein